MENTSKHWVLLIFSVFVLLGALRSNGLFTGEDLLVYSSGYNRGQNSITDVQMRFDVYDNSGIIEHLHTSNRFTLIGHEEEGRLVMGSGSDFKKGNEYYVAVTATTKNNERQKKYLLVG